MRFDTLDYARRLETAGVPAVQAEVQARALGEALGGAVAFRGDLAALENNLSLQMSAIENRLETKIETVRAELEAKIETVSAGLEAKIETVSAGLEAKIEAVKTELKLDLGGRIETLKWMFGALVALNVGILLRLLLVH